MIGRIFNRAGKVGVGIFIVLATLVGLQGAAWAPFWGWATSDLDIGYEDLSLCADELEMRARYQVNGLPMDAYDNTLGTPFAGRAGFPSDSIATIELYATASDAVSGVGEIAVVTVPVVLTEQAVTVEDSDGDPSTPIVNVSGAAWEGIGTETGHGIPNGTVVYTQQIDPDDVTAVIARPLTIGAPEYGCAPVTSEFEFDLAYHGEYVRIPTWWPRLISFDSTDIDVYSLEAMADNGSVTSVRYIGDWHGQSWGLVKMRRAGVNCDSTSLIVTATTISGDSVSGEHELFPYGRRCR